MDIEFEQAFQKIVLKIEESGNEYAEAKAVSWQMQELVSSVRSKIALRFSDVPASKADMMAKADDEYVQYVKETAEAIKDELRKKAVYEKWKSAFEAKRSLSSLEKRTRTLIDGE